MASQAKFTSSSSGYPKSQDQSIREGNPVAKEGGREWKKSSSEKVLCSKWFLGAMCVSFVAGIVLASITACPSISHAMGTAIPQAAGGSLIAIALVGLSVHRIKQNHINERTWADQPQFQQAVERIQEDQILEEEIIKRCGIKWLL